jgi:hypothetical protein
MQQSIVKFIAWSHRRCSTCFGRHYTHHQKLPQTAVAASGFHVNDEVDVFPAVVGLLVLTNRPRLETHPPRHLYGNRRLRLHFERAPDDGRNAARNMLSGVYVTKQ